MFEFYKSNIDDEKLTLAVERANASIKEIPRGALAAHFYLFEQRHPATARHFADDLAKPIRAGRKLEDMLKLYRKQNMGRINDTWANALLVNAWNAYRKGSTVTAAVLRWNDNMEYPAIG